MAGIAIACAAACREPEGTCAQSTDCATGQECVSLSADAARGVCVESAEPGWIPGTIADISIAREQRLDILFVVDDGPALADRQAQVAAASAALVEAILARRPNATLRVGFTTTSNEHPLCDAPPGGLLQATSCRERLDGFTASVDGVDLDVRGACTDACGLDSLALRPTTTEFDPEPRVRPWIELDPWGTGNLPDGVGLAEALRCAAPPGIAGCRFASPLEAARLALARADHEEEASFGFVREFSDLLIVVIGAGNDCSLANGAEGIFLDNPVFWGDLMPPDLTPAVCWRAGVRCEGPGPVYADCTATDLDASGQPTTQDQASLTPVESLVQRLDSVRDSKQQYDVDALVALHVVGGLPADGTPPVYADASDPAFQREHGIGPGCEQSGMRAPPPVRLLAVADATEHGAVPASSSVCPDDWTGSMRQLGEAAASHLRPGCFPRCARDQDPSTPALEPRCEVVRSNYLENFRMTLPTCVLQDGAPVAPFDAPACYVLRTGDALSPECAEEGFNVEFEIYSAAPDPPGTDYLAGCELSPIKSKDCPLL